MRRVAFPSPSPGAEPPQCVWGTRDRAYPEMHSPVTLLRHEGNLLELAAEPELLPEESMGRVVRDLEGRPVYQLWVKVSVTNC